MFVTGISFDVELKWKGDFSVLQDVLGGDSGFLEKGRFLRDREPFKDMDRTELALWCYGIYTYHAYNARSASYATIYEVDSEVRIREMCVPQALLRMLSVVDFGHLAVLGDGLMGDSEFFRIFPPTAGWRRGVNCQLCSNHVNIRDSQIKIRLVSLLCNWDLRLNCLFCCHLIFIKLSNNMIGRQAWTSQKN